jgi:hypothetical protein
MTRKEKEKKKIYQRNSQHGLQPEVDSVGKENVPMMPKHAEKIPHRQWYRMYSIIRKFFLHACATVAFALRAVADAVRTRTEKLPYYRVHSVC